MTHTHHTKALIFALVLNLVFSIEAISTPRVNESVEPLAPHAIGHLANRLKSAAWPAYWIGVPNENQDEYMVRYYRKKLTLDSEKLGNDFWVHVSADERYKLFVNGHLVSIGPSRGDMLNWKYETVDLRPYLHEGDNAICAIVWYFCSARPGAQMTYGECGFLMQGDTEREDIINTNSTWRCIRNTGYSICRKGTVRGYYTAGALEQIDMSKMPKDWLKEDFDDSQWKIAFGQFRAAPKGCQNYSFRQMVERPIPQMERKICKPLKIRKSYDESATFEYSPSQAKDWESIVIPAHTKKTFILDQRELVTGYLNMVLSKGKGASVSIGYAETLFSRDSKGNLLPIGSRDSIHGKVFIGYKDSIICDGTVDFTFCPLWWRTWRYVQISIETKDEPLTIGDIWGQTSMYPFEKTSTFVANEDPELSKIIDVGWRTARLCANETYMDCPYYEQLQYFGDTRIQTMVSMYNTRDSLMVRQAIEMGNQSLLPDGLLQSRFPSGILQIIPSYSLSWIGMVYDYYMYRNDPMFIKRMLPTTRRILAWYEEHLKNDGTLEHLPYWFFCDWASNFNFGTPFCQDDGYSAYQDLALLMALDEAISMEKSYGISGMAQHYQLLANKIRSKFKEHYWDSTKQEFADTKDKRNYSQHTNIMAILCDIVTGEDAKALCQKILSDKSLTQATIYFRYYLFAAMKKAGLSDKFLDEIGIWRQQLKDDMTTWAEMPEPTRSDCHAWGASPNIELFRIVLGIDSKEPGFNNIQIAPSLGTLKKVSGSIPHPKGTISVDLEIKPNGKLKKNISLPPGVEADFIWNGTVEKLQ